MDFVLICALQRSGGLVGGVVFESLLPIFFLFFSHSRRSAVGFAPCGRVLFGCSFYLMGFCGLGQSSPSVYSVITPENCGPHHHDNNSQITSGMTFQSVLQIMRRDKIKWGKKSVGSIAMGFRVISIRQLDIISLGVFPFSE